MAAYFYCGCIVVALLFGSSIKANDLLDAMNGKYIFAELSKSKPNENLFISPLSITAALTLLLEGSAGETETQLVQLLQHSNFKHFRKVFVTLPTERAIDQVQSASASSNQSFDLASAAFVHDLLRIKPAFTDQLRFHKSEIKPVNFERPGTARKAINSWIASKTNGKIQDLLNHQSITPSTRLVLVNAVYFCGAWKYKFDTTLTKQLPFGHSENLTPFMTSQNINVPYYTNDDFTAIKLPYIDERMKMIVVLPNHPAMKILNGDSLFRVLNEEFQPETLELLQVPRFGLEFQVSLKETLRALGVKDMFTDGVANFTKITDESLFVNDLYHKTYLKVTEDGTEAVGATAVILATRSARAGIRFVANRPFYFAIRYEPTGTLIFLGHLVQP